MELWNEASTEQDRVFREMRVAALAGVTSVLFNTKMRLGTIRLIAYIFNYHLSQRYHCWCRVQV